MSLLPTGTPLSNKTSIKYFENINDDKKSKEKENYSINELEIDLNVAFLLFGTPLNRINYYKINHFHKKEINRNLIN